MIKSSAGRPSGSVYDEGWASWQVGSRREGGGIVSGVVGLYTAKAEDTSETTGSEIIITYLNI